MHYTYTDSPVGRLLLAGEGGALCLVGFQSAPAPRQPEPSWVRAEAPLREAVRQLRAYFDGRLRSFDLELVPRGTDFQKRVWDALRSTPYGETVSYGELSRRIGRPTASRAVGAANRANPLPIVLPCHRVIGSTGQLVGYASGLDIKKTLLALEARCLRSRAA